MSNNLNIDENINEKTEDLNVATEDVNTEPSDQVAMEDDNYNTTNVSGDQIRNDYSVRNSADIHTTTQYNGPPNIADSGNFSGMIRSGVASGIRNLIGSAYRIFEPVVTNVLFTFWDMLNNPKGSMP